MKPHLDFRNGLWRCRIRAPWGDYLPVALAATMHGAYEMLMLYVARTEGVA